MATDFTKAQAMAEQRMKEFYDYLRLQSISAQKKMIPETVMYIREMVEHTGGEVQVLDDLGGNPVIYAFFPAGPNGNSEKTLLFYNHYDVQPPEPLAEWHTEPFEPTEKEGILYARGVADDKADFMVRLNALQVLQDGGGLPCNVKFLLEGEEEIGSPNLGRYIEKYADLFQADACIWEGGSKDRDENYVITAGMKGIAYFNLKVTTADTDIHSSMAAVIDNPAWRLVHALSSMKNSQGEILVEGFYDGVQPLTEQDREAARQQPFNQQETKRQYGLKGPLLTEGTETHPNEALAYHPTMTICGIESGYNGEGVKTVLPRTATAKLDCRMVPGQKPQHIYELIRQHLDKHGFADVELELASAEGAQRTLLDDPFLQEVVSIAKEVYEPANPVIVSPSMAGTGPAELFDEYLKVPVVGAGTGWAFSGPHAPNESIRLQDFYQNIAFVVELLQRFGQS